MTVWEKALTLAEEACPYRDIPDYPPLGEKPSEEMTAFDALPQEERNRRWDESDARAAWLAGFPFGFLGVPDEEIYRRDDRWFWAGYEAGVLAEKTAGKA